MTSSPALQDHDRFLPSHGHYAIALHDAGALPTPHDCYGISTDRIVESIKQWM